MVKLLKQLPDEWLDQADSYTDTGVSNEAMEMLMVHLELAEGGFHENWKQQLSAR